MPLRAVIRDDAPIKDVRSAARRTLCLGVPAYLSGDANEAIVHNLSETGLLLETIADLQVGESFQVDLPHAGMTTAIVIWNHGQLLGCEFASPVSNAAISAALLRNPFEAVREQTDPAADFAPEPEYGPTRLESEQAPGSKTVLNISLLMSLGVALAFVVALFAFPFST